MDSDRSTAFVLGRSDLSDRFVVRFALLDLDRSVVARRSVKGPVSDRRSLRLRCLDRCGLDGKVDALLYRDLPVLIKSVFGHRLVRIDNFKPSAPASRSVRRFLSVCRDA